MIRRKEVKGLFLLSVSITVFLGLSSLGCKKKSEKPEPTGQAGYPSSTTGQTTFTGSATFTNPNDAATKTFGSLSVASDNIITARASQSEMITGRMITGRAITARIITGRIITARSPKFIDVSENDKDDDEDDILNLFGRLKKGRLSKKQSGELEISCEDVKPKCVDGKVENAYCNQSTNRISFDIKLSDCKEIVDEQKGEYIVSTGYARGYLEISTKVSQGSSEAKFIVAIEDGDSLVREFSGNKETKRVKAKASNFRTEITGRFIEGEKDVDFRVVTKLSGSYSREDEIGNRKEAYSYSDYVVELTGRSPKSGGEPTLHMSIAGGYSVDTEPDSCVEGVFNFKTIKPIKSSGGQGYCGAESGEIEVNNAKIEFSSGKVKVSVEDQQKEYRCEDLGGLCKYEPITIAEGVEQKPCPVWFKDKDKDGYTDGTTKVACEKPSDEYVSSATAGDCNDSDSSMNPGKAEICDNKDNNCNGLIDEGVKLVFYKDLDGDGYTDGTTSVGCSAPSGYVLSATSGDCNDNDPNINPGKAEICDGIDNNCNGQPDEGFNVGQSCTVGVGECARTGQFVCKADGTGTECNATPGTPTPEVCDGLDNNCNGIIDDGVLLVFYKDMDGDGYTDGTTSVGCSAPSGYVLSATSGDCNDNDPNVNPGKTEICDGIDNNCNGQPDEGFNVGQSCTVGVGECARTGQFVCKADGTGTECNATPGTPTTEICDGEDNDCDGQTDEGNVCGIAGGPRAKVSAGGYHTCAVKTDGSLWCWGGNDYGQLGDGTYTDRTTPVQITSGVSSVALGLWHTCAVKTDGSLWCWGDNDYGQLGDGTNTSRNTPVQIASGVSSVSLGGSHTCAVKTDGSLWCWGRNNYGQLGDGNNTSRNTPVQIMSSGVSSVALGGAHTCAVKTDGSLWCWGDNDYGQLGDGTNTSRTTPVQIMSSGVSSVALGLHHTCAVKTDGSLWCWGDNDYGQLGDGTNTSRNTPVQIMSSGVSSVALGDYHTCVVKTDGSLWCWGRNNYGQLGDGTNSDKNTPVQIMSSGVSSVALGGAHTCAVKTDGSLWCWGWNGFGQLGDGGGWKNTPVYIMNLGSGGGGAPSIRDESSFGNREQKQTNIEQKQIRYGCSSANIVFYVLHLIFSAFILFALLKRRFFVRN